MVGEQVLANRCVCVGVALYWLDEIYFLDTERDVTFSTNE
jgi:hypothetical protein